MNSHVIHTNLTTDQLLWTCDVCRFRSLSTHWIYFLTSVL